MNFKPGDKVRLNTGGPVMSVEMVGPGADSPSISCVWFERPHPADGLWTGPHRQNFNTVVLVLVTDDPKEAK